jgi:hypothetical protein
MVAAGYRCQCTGACGKHQSDYRCPSTWRTERLVAMPAEPTDDVHAAVRAPLAAWCRPCYNAALRRAVKLAAQDAAAAAETLF